MWEIVRAGGPLMWPISLCSITGAAIVLERLWTLQDKRVLPQELPERVWQLIEANQVNDKVIATLEQNSPLGRLLATGLANRHRSREMLMERLEDTGRHVVHELERFLNTLGTIAGVSPLLGLLGTVTGIIRSFNLSQAGSLGVHLPHASAVPGEKVSGEPLVVSVTQQGGYLVNGHELINSSPETLRAALLKEAGTNRGIRVTMRADARATHQSVITAMDVLGRLGFSEVNIATVKEEAAGKP